MREQHDLTVRELKCIVVRARIILIDLPKPRHLMVECGLAFLEENKLEPSEHTFHFIFKADLGARKKAHGHVGLFDRGKAACHCVVESRCH